MKVKFYILLILFIGMVTNMLAQCNPDGSISNGPDGPVYYPCAVNDSAIANGVVAVNENHQAGFHIQLLKTSSGYLVTGDYMDGLGGSQLSFTNVPGPNYPMNGAYPIFGTVGGRQATFLGSDASFYTMGRLGLPPSMTSSFDFQKINDLTLPPGVSVCDVVKFHGTDRMLSFLTASGNLYVLGEDASFLESSAFDATVFTKVTMPAGVKVSDYNIATTALIVLGTDGVLYRSGRTTYAGDGSDFAFGVNKPAPFPVQPPISAFGIAGLEISGEDLFGQRSTTYFVLDGDGTVHTLGQNSNDGVAGVGIVDDILFWDKVGSACPNGILDNVVRLTVSANTFSFRAATVILADSSIRSWGSNNKNMITGPDDSLRNPCPITPCGADNFDQVISIANGGHITPIIRNDGVICNIGHNQDGGFGTGTEDDRACYFCDTIPVLRETILCDQVNCDNIEDTSLSYEDAFFCVDNDNPSPFVQPIIGGVFTINNDGVIDPLSGEIDLLSSGMGRFTITYSSSACPNSTSVSLDIADCSNAGVHVPNTFTPNSDGINESIYPIGEYITDDGYLFSIFNRWGQIIFESTLPFDGWDGKKKEKDMPQGVYIWNLQYTNKDKEKEEIVGKVALIR